MALPQTVAELTDAVLGGEFGVAPAELSVTSAFWLHHTTRLAGSRTTYRNHYVLLRVGTSFGACSFEPGEIDVGYCEGAWGEPLDTLIRCPSLPVRVAALDAYLAEVAPHRRSAAERVELPAGTP